MSRWNREELFNLQKKKFEDTGCRTLETTWKPSNCKWRYICNCGEVKEITPAMFNSGQRCRECGYKNRKIPNKFTKEDILEFMREGDEYLEHYVKDNETRLRYRCKNGHERDVSASLYKSRNNCLICFREWQRGENHPLYNPNKTWEQREKDRKHYKTERWREAVFERDGYTCQKCGQIGWDLNAHHIFPYKDFPNRRLDVTNGITLCEFCHKWFHWEYGSHYETAEDFYNYMEW